MTKPHSPRKSRRAIESSTKKGRVAAGTRRPRAEPAPEAKAPRSRRPAGTATKTATKSATKDARKTPKKAAKAAAEAAPKSAKRGELAKRASRAPAKRASVAPSARRASQAPVAPTRVTRKSATLESGSPAVASPRAPLEPPTIDDSSPDTIPPVTARFQVAPDSPGVPAEPASGPPSEPDTRRSRRPRKEPASRPPLVAGYDLDADEASFVAPVGPTEVARPVGEEPTGEGREPARVEELERQIHDLEARLDQMIGEAKEAHAATAAQESVAGPLETATGRGAPYGAQPRDVVASHRYLQGWRQKAMRDHSEEVDDFGLDPSYEARAKPFLDFLHRHYFRVDVEGTRNIPSEGRCLIVGNHSGGPLPYDGLVLRSAVRREHPTHRELRWLAEDFIYYLPFVGTMMSRLGAVRACQENAERVLRKDGALLVFPEGEKGVGKLYRDRYRLQRFGRGGYVRLGLRTRTPIIPVAIVGAEEANPVLYRVEYMAKALGLPFLPVTPTFPALGPVGLLPAPTKWTIRFGEPITFDDYGPQAADDEILVRRLSDQVRGSIQGMLDRTLSDRRSIWFG